MAGANATVQVLEYARGQPDKALQGLVYFFQEEHMSHRILKDIIWMSDTPKYTN